eukprot:jgi/Ulvmu1/7026/UM033_0085.1
MTTSILLNLALAWCAVRTVNRFDSAPLRRCRARHSEVAERSEVMEDSAELPDIRFFGLVVKGGKTATYRIENEPGVMEICHLTNCALCSASTSTKPVYVKIKSPDVNTQFVLGALIPGKVLSFTTDLLITPDTEFCHTGSPEDEVHLTGYRSFDAANLLVEDDDDDDDDEVEDDDDDEEEDKDFVDHGAGDSEEMSSDANSSLEDSEEDDIAAEESEPELDERELQRALQAGRHTAAPQKGARQGSESDVSDEDGEGKGGSPDISQKMIEMLEQRHAGEDVMGDEDESMEGSGGGSDDEEEDDSADRSAKAKAIEKARLKKREIDREKKRQKRQLPESAEMGPTGAPEEAPVKRSKQTDVEKPQHPHNSNENTRTYAERIYLHLKASPSGLPLDRVSTTIDKPANAEKIGKLLKKYSTWFKRETLKGDHGSKDVIKLAE